MSETLKSIVKSSLDLEQKLIDAEGVLTDDLAGEIALCEKSMAVKVDAYAHIISRMKDAIDRHKEARQAHAAYIKNLESSIEWLQYALKSGLNVLNRSELLGDHYQAKTRLNPASCEITDLDAIPAEYKIIKTEVVVDKAALLEVLKMGVDIRGANLKQTERVEIKPRKF
jgi:hypothetical protein